MDQRTRIAGEYNRVQQHLVTVLGSKPQQTLYSIVHRFYRLLCHKCGGALAKRPMH